MSKSGKKSDEIQTSAPEKFGTKDYERELAKLHVELVKLQEWVRHKGLKICIVFEGRDGAGKGGTIKAITERVSPRVFRVVALPSPTEREKSQMYVQRYMRHFPAAGEVVIFDRSWYNRAGVEKVMGFCSDKQHRLFLECAAQHPVVRGQVAPLRTYARALGPAHQRGHVVLVDTVDLSPIESGGAVFDRAFTADHSVNVDAA